MNETHTQLVEWIRANWEQRTKGQKELRPMELARFIASWPVHPRSADSAKQLVYRFTKDGVFKLRYVDGTALYSLAPFTPVPVPHVLVQPAPAAAPRTPVVPPAVAPAVAAAAPVAPVVAAPVAPVVATKVAEADPMMHTLMQISMLMQAAGLRKVVVEDGNLKYERQVVIKRSFRL